MADSTSNRTDLTVAFGAAVSGKRLWMQWHSGKFLREIADQLNSRDPAPPSIQGSHWRHEYVARIRTAAYVALKRIILDLTLAAAIECLERLAPSRMRSANGDWNRQNDGAALAPP